MGKHKKSKKKSQISKDEPPTVDTAAALQAALDAAVASGKALAAVALAQAGTALAQASAALAK